MKITEAKRLSCNYCTLEVLMIDWLKIDAKICITIILSWPRDGYKYVYSEVVRLLYDESKNKKEMTKLDAYKSICSARL